MNEVTPSTLSKYGMRSEFARRRITSFGRRFGQAHLYLAYHAAFPLALTPDLLYRLWANFPRDIHGMQLNIPWVAVADLLLSTLCEEVSQELFEMNTAVRTELLRELRADPNFGPRRINELSDFLLTYIQKQLKSHDDGIRDFAEAQQWTALAYTKPKEAARELALALTESFEKKDKAEQIRIASLIEAFVEPLEGFSPLLTYARGIADFARGDLELAKKQFGTLAEREHIAETLGVHLPIPEQLRKESEEIRLRAQEDLKEYFLSYCSPDLPWAEWIAWQLENEGYSTVLQAWDFRAGSDLILEMDKAAREAKRIIAVLSPDYFKSKFTPSEWATVFRRNPKGEHGLLVPVRVRKCDVEGLLGPIIYIDLVDLDEDKASKTLLVGIQHERTKPRIAPGYPPTVLNLRVKRPHFPGPSMSIQYIPYQRNKYFTGRRDFLENLRNSFKRLKVRSLKQPLAISGLIGIGKTQIALEYAYRYQSDYRFILWVRATSQETLYIDLLNIAKLLNLSEKDVKDREIVVDAVKRWLKEKTRWLLVLDEVNDPSVLRDFGPLAKKGHILLTTRDTSILELAEKHELEKMNPEEGALFLLRRAEIIPLDEELELASENAVVAREISFKLDGHPLAIDHAGAYIAETDCGLKGYLERYERLYPELLRYVPQRDNKSVATSLALSFEEVRQAHPIAAELLQFCAFLHPNAIPEEIIIGGAPDFGRKFASTAANEIRLDKIIAVLRRFSLIRRNADEKTLTIHGLLQTILKTEMRRSDQHRWAERAVRAMNRAFPEVEISTWSLCQRYLPHALVCATHISDWNMTFVEAARLLYRSGQYLLERALYSKAKDLLIGARVIYEKNLGSESLEMAAILDDLGRLYTEQGSYTAYTDAELLYVQALAISEKVLGPDDPKITRILNHLGLLYYNQGKYNKAEPLYIRAQKIQEQAGDSYASDLAITLNNLAWLNHSLGQYEVAEPLLKRALEIQEKPEGSEPPEMAATLNALAILYRSKGNYLQAESLFQRALGIRERIRGQQHPEVATTLNDLAWLYHTLGKYEQAQEYYKRALEIREKTLEQGHLHVATTLNDMAALYTDLGQYVQAEHLYKRSLTIRESILGAKHTRVGDSLYYIGWLYYHMGKFAEAESLHKRALEIKEKALGMEHTLHIAQILNALAEVYRAQGKYAQAEQECARALKIRQNTLDPIHRNVISSLNNLATIYVERGKYAEAEELYKQALILRDKTPGSELPRMTVILYNVANLYVEQGKYATAEILYNQAITLYEKVLDKGHPDIASVINNLALLYILQGRYDQAKSYCERALDARKDALGPDHPDVGKSYECLALIYQKQRRYQEAEALHRRALSICEKTLGPDHPYIAQIHDNLGLLYVAQELYTLVEPLFLSALKIREDTLGPVHPHVAQSLNNLAEIYRIQERYADAEEFYIRALLIDEQVLGLEHIHVATVLEGYATLKRVMEQWAEAIRFEERAQAIQTKHAKENPAWSS